MKIFAIAGLMWCAGTSLASAQVDRSRAAAPAHWRAFQPRLVPDVAPAPLLYRSQTPDPKSLPSSTAQDRIAPSPQRYTRDSMPPAEEETVCGMRIIRPSVDVDPRIRIQADLSTGIRTRRIEPNICTAARN